MEVSRLFPWSALCFMKGVHRVGHQRASCLLCQSVLYLSSCHPCSRTTVLPGCICPLLSPWDFQPCYPSWAVFFVSHSPGGCYLTISVSVLMLHPFVGSHYALWKRIDTFSRDLLAFKPLTLHGVINKSLSSIVPGLTIKYFVSGRCHSYFSCANLAQAIFGKYLSAAWNFASLFLQIICGSLPHFLLNAELNKIRFSINFP